MVEHEELVLELVDQVQGHREVAREQQQIVRELDFPEPPDAAAKLRPQHEAVVGLVVNHVTHAHQLRMAREALELRGQLAGAEVDPAHDALDRSVALGKRQQPLGLRERLPGLYCDRAVEAGRLKQRGELLGQIVAPQCGHRVRHPDMLGGIVVPEVLMGVDAQCVNPRPRPSKTGPIGAWLPATAWAIGGAEAACSSGRPGVVARHPG